MPDFSFAPGSRVPADEWTTDGKKITSPENLAAIRQTLDQTGPVLLEHKFLRGARAPSTLAFDDYDELMEYLTRNARAGDKITVWSVSQFMSNTTPIAFGKCPDADGAVPNRGPY